MIVLFLPKILLVLTTVIVQTNRVIENIVWQ